jgi:hypothetical protein
MLRRPTTHLLLALALAMPVATRAAVPASALGANGEVYRAVTGTYGDLFPGGQEARHGAPVLALDVIGANEVQRWIAPGTASDDIETSVAVVFERASETLYLVWSTNFNLVHSRISVIGFRDGAWGEPIEIVGDPFSLKGSPRIAITRDTLVSRDAGGATSTHERTILHALWWEDGGLGERILYSPLILVDGVFVGEKPLIALDTLVETESLDSGAAVQRELALAPALDEGDSPSRLVASFAVPRTSRFTVVELEPVPLELAALAGSARRQIVDATARACAGDTTIRLGDSARAHIVVVGRNDLHPSVIRHVASVTSEALDQVGLADACADPETLAAQAEDLVVESAMDALRNGLLKKASPARAHIVVVGRQEPGGALHKIRVQKTAERPAPLSAPSETYVFASRDGRRSVVAWRDPHGVAFVESRTDAEWSDTTLLRTDELLDFDEALAILGRRVSEP